MQKPKQYAKLHKNPDNIDLLTELEGAMDSIADAMKCLAGYEDFADWFDALGEIWDEMKPNYDEYEAIDTAEYGQEIAALTRDYYRSVM